MERLKAVWPEVWKLMRPRRGLLAIGFVLMVINKLAGFVLPYSSKFLIDNVVSKTSNGAVAADRVRGIGGHSSPGYYVVFADTAALESRAKVDCGSAASRCRRTSRGFPSPTTTANKTGALVSRIMSDVEGVRNLLGTGLVEFRRRASSPPGSRWCCCSALASR